MLTADQDPMDWLTCAQSVAKAAVDESVFVDRMAQSRRLLSEVPPKSLRTAEQERLVRAIVDSCRTTRARFVASHVDRIYDRLTETRTARKALSDIVYEAAVLIPGLVPTREQVELARGAPQSEKDDCEIDQGILISGLLRSAVSGTHLIETMMLPSERGVQLLPQFRREGLLDLGTVRVERVGPAAYLTVQNGRFLNAEDNTLIADMEVAVDIALLDDSVLVGVLRGGSVTHPRYYGKRVFSAGINLKHLHDGKISYVDFLLRRELGYIHKIRRGLFVREAEQEWNRKTIEKPWIAAVDSFAIGGGAQLLLVFDKVIAASDSYFSLPAANEGIIPGAANLRLSAAVGPRMARQIILFGRKVWAREPAAAALFDEVVDTAAMDQAIEESVRLLSAAAVVPNRRMLGLAEERAISFREYMAEFALQQSIRLYSDDVVAKEWRSSR